jgi:hypothetical protein
MIKIIKNNSGSSFIDALIAVAILVIFSAIYSGGLIQFKKHAERAVNINVADKEVLAVIESVRLDLGSQKLNFVEGASGIALELDPAKLPYAWSKFGTVKAADCPTCIGKYGYTIQPVTGFSGLFVTTIRMTHKDWPTYKDFKFIIK